MPVKVFCDKCQAWSEWGNHDFKDCGGSPVIVENETPSTFENWYDDHIVRYEIGGCCNRPMTRKKEVL